LSLSPGDVRPESEARVRLLRAADPARRPTDRENRPGPRPQDRRVAREHGPLGTRSQTDLPAEAAPQSCDLHRRRYHHVLMDFETQAIPQGQEPDPTHGA